MNNLSVMSASFEAKKNSQATMITIGFAALLLVLMFIWTWTIPAILPPPADQGMMVEMEFPEEEMIPMKQVGGGGGGGNPVEASGPAGAAPQSPPQPGTNKDSRDIEDDPKEKETAPVIKPDNPKPKAEKVNENKSPVKTTPKPVPEPAQPKPVPKAVLGKTTTGSGNGGGTATNYDRAGGSGTGSGVGNGSGSGGGSGTGSGGGNGSGSGRGNGPMKISGNRVVINPRPMSAGENLKGKVLAQIRVSPDGVGTYLNWVQGSTITNGEAISIIKDWLRRNRFDKSDQESIVVYQFNFLLGG